MLIRARSTSYVQTLRLKKIGLFLASLWVIVLVAGIASTIYRKVDGPTIRNVSSQNRNLSSINSTLSTNLTSAKSANETTTAELFAAEDLITRLNTSLEDSRIELAEFKHQCETFVSSIPLTDNPHLVLFFPAAEFHP